MKDGTCWRIETDNAVFAIVVNEQSIVVDTPPIGKWMRGAKLQVILDWCRLNHFKAERL